MHVFFLQVGFVSVIQIDVLTETGLGLRMLLVQVFQVFTSLAQLSNLVVDFIKF